MMHVQCTLCSSLRFKLFIHHSIVYIQTVLTRTVPRPRRSCTARRAPHLGLPRLVCTARRAPHPGRRAPHPGPWTLPVIVRAKSGCCPSCARRMACAFVPATQQAALAELRHRRPWPGATVISKLLTELFSRFFFRHQRKKRKKLHQHKKKMKQSWQPKCTSSSPHLLSFSHPQLELASVSPSLSLTLFVFLSLSLSLPLSPLCYSLSFLSSLCFCLRECLLLSM